MPVADARRAVLAGHAGGPGASSLGGPGAGPTAADDAWGPRTPRPRLPPDGTTTLFAAPEAVTREVIGTLAAPGRRAREVPRRARQGSPRRPGHAPDPGRLRPSQDAREQEVVTGAPALPSALHADEILDKVAAHCRRISDSGHWKTPPRSQRASATDGAVRFFPACTHARRSIASSRVPHPASSHCLPSAPLKRRVGGGHRVGLAQSLRKGPCRGRAVEPCSEPSKRGQASVPKSPSWRSPGQHAWTPLHPMLTVC